MFNTRNYATESFIFISEFIGYSMLFDMMFSFNIFYLYINTKD